MQAAKQRGVTLQGAIFDCDGLLADTETPDFNSWREVYAAHGLELPLSEWAAFIGTAKETHLKDWHAPLSERVGAGYNRAAVTAARRARYRERVAALRPMPGVVALLDALAADGIPCAVASNSVRVWVDEVLQITSMTGKFAAIATADEVENPKPAPDVYLLAAQKLGVDPTACVAFEDSPRGLAAAHAAGMVTVAVPTDLTRHMDFAQAHHLVESLEHLTLENLTENYP